MPQHTHRIFPIFAAALLATALSACDEFPSGHAGKQDLSEGPKGAKKALDKAPKAESDKNTPKKKDVPKQVAQKAPNPKVKLPPEAKTRRLSRAKEPDVKREGTALSIKQSAIATAVDKRKPVGAGNRFRTDVGKLNAYVRVKNDDDPTHITMVWKHNGVARSKVKLKVGKSPNWRTWSSKDIEKKDAGLWSVDVLGPTGVVLDTLTFNLFDPST